MPPLFFNKKHDCLFTQSLAQYLQAVNKKDVAYW